jgi:hypothetical protein
MQNAKSGNDVRIFSQLFHAGMINSQEMAKNMTPVTAMTPRPFFELRTADEMRQTTAAIRKTK